jgi:hypothetical protein
MMGRREGGQGQFFYAFDLDQVVPADHLVRQIDGVIDLGYGRKFQTDTQWPAAPFTPRRFRLLIKTQQRSQGFRSCRFRLGKTDAEHFLHRPKAT